MCVWGGGVIAPLPLDPPCVDKARPRVHISSVDKRRPDITYNPPIRSETGNMPNKLVRVHTVDKQIIAFRSVSNAVVFLH